MDIVSIQMNGFHTNSGTANSHFSVSFALRLLSAISSWETTKHNVLRPEDLKEQFYLWLLEDADNGDSFPKN